MTPFDLIPLPTLTLFFLASVGLALSPGPDNLYVLSLAALRGHVAGLLVTLGLCTGLLVHTAAVVLGVAVLLQDSRLAFTVLKVAGAAYLLYLAWLEFHAAAQHTPATSRSMPSAAALYRRGVIMNVTNPKVSVFFLAFLPQFSDPARGRVAGQLVLLGLVFIAAALLVFSAIALLSSRLGHLLQRNPRLQLRLHRFAAIIFVVLAANLLLSSR